jgi:hypothetical protein
MTIIYVMVQVAREKLTAFADNTETIVNHSRTRSFSHNTGCLQLADRGGDTLEEEPIYTSHHLQEPATFTKLLNG